MRPAHKLLLLTIALVLLACGASAREKTIRATFVATNVAHQTFVTFDRQYQKLIVRNASTYEAGLAALDAYHDKQARLLDLFDLVYRSIDIATRTNDQPSLAALLEAAALLQIELAKLTGSSP